MKQTLLHAETCNTSDWIRLQEVISYSGMNIHAFAHHIGLKYSQNLYQIKVGKNRLGRELCQKVVEAFPEVSFEWLFTGRGQMFDLAGLPEDISFPITLRLTRTQLLELLSQLHSKR